MTTPLLQQTSTLPTFLTNTNDKLLQPSVCNAAASREGELESDVVIKASSPDYLALESIWVSGSLGNPFMPKWTDNQPGIDLNRQSQANRAGSDRVQILQSMTTVWGLEQEMCGFSTHRY